LWLEKIWCMYKKPRAGYRVYIRKLLEQKALQTTARRISGSINMHKWDRGFYKAFLSNDLLLKGMETALGLKKEEIHEILTKHQIPRKMLRR
jgi:hypothetical protein